MIIKNLTQPRKKGETDFCDTGIIINLTQQGKKGVTGWKVIIKNLTQQGKKGVTGFCEKWLLKTSHNQG